MILDLGRTINHKLQIMSISNSTLNEESVFHAVKEMYEEVAATPDKGFHFPTGRNSCRFLGYPEDLLNSIPATAIESFAGVGYPFHADLIRRGHTVVDIGSGSGTDVLIAALKTGPEGQVFGIDMTEEMIVKAEKNIEIAGLYQAKIIKGQADHLPIEDASVDVVISNGVFNLVPAKNNAFKEAYRILKPGGEIQIADIVLSKPVSGASKSNPQLWAECIVGAEPVDRYLEIIRSAGFKNVRVIDRLDYFNRSTNEATRKAAKDLGAHTVVLTGEKPN